MAALKVNFLTNYGHKLNKLTILSIHYLKPTYKIVYIVDWSNTFHKLSH